MSFMMNVLSEDTLSDERLDEIIEESREYLRRVEPEVSCGHGTGRQRRLLLIKERMENL